MAKRILPYRDYSEHEVLNIFSLDVDAGDNLADWKTSGPGGKWDSGLVVSVKAGALPGEVPSELATAAGGNLRDYLGADFANAHIGFNGYPAVGMTVEPAADGDRGIGITLRETLAYDENGEKLLYYKQKLDESYGVLPGQAVPILTRGTVLLHEDAFAAAPGLGDELETAANGELKTLAGGISIGQVLAIGQESDNTAVKKYLCKISF